jgi:beta-glucosidase/6-phospho-beta-glucosidase/beta-galactosidase
MRVVAGWLAVLGAVVACGGDGSGAESPPANTPGADTPAAPAESAPEQGSGAAGDEPVGTFPKGFLFGTALAGFQVDMGCPTLRADVCEDRQSDWYQWITTKRILDNPLLFMSKDPPSSGPGFYELFEQDIERAAGKGPAQLGSNALRLSIEWSRVFPRPTWDVRSHESLKAIASADALAFYHRIFAAMKARGLTPLVTLNHYSLPLWVHDGNACNENLDACVAAGKGGWADPNRARIVNEMAKYAAFVATEFGAEVDRWATLNEPFSAVVFPGYLLATPMRSNPPGLSGPWARIDAAKTAATAMIEAHARMYDAVKAFDRVDADGDGKNAEVGIVYAFSEIAPATDSEKDRTAAQHAEYVFHDMFMDGVVFGRVDENWDQGPDKARVRPEIAGRIDFIGLNYYFRFTAKSGSLPIGFVSPFFDFDPLAPLDPVPRGIYPALMRVARRYGKPIYVTETGTTQDDEPRGAAWLVQTFSEVRRAIADGADVRGYFAWSLMDNYEWNHGMGMRFGLYAVHPETKHRALRDAGEVFAEIARTRDVSSELEKKYAGFFQ